MIEKLTFANIEPGRQNQLALSEIGRNENGTGVLQELAVAFGVGSHNFPTVVDGLGALIGAVGTHKTLQDNIVKVQEVIGTSDDAVSVARGWVSRSGLLVPVKRPFMVVDSRGEENTPLPEEVDVAVITGAVRNWMQRRMLRALVDDVAPNDTLHFGRVILAAGMRVMNTSEGVDVREGMTEANYMDSHIRPAFEDQGCPTEFIPVGSTDGLDVMKAVANKIRPSDRVMYVGNAGQWVQGAGQFRRAARAIMPDFDEGHSQLYVESDGFPLGTGIEPTATHQNPLTALGQIVRNMQELARHMG